MVTDRLDMTLRVDRAVKRQHKQIDKILNVFPFRGRFAKGQNQPFNNSIIDVLLVLISDRRSFRNLLNFDAVSILKHVV